MKALRETIHADARGRVSLGAAFANCTLLVENVGDGIIIRRARVVPEREAWLYENEEAIRRVRVGLGQASRRQFAEPPSLEDAQRIAGAGNDVDE